MHLKAVHWGAALVSAVVIHIGAALMLGWLPSPGGVTAPGSRGFEVSLGLTAGSPGVATEIPLHTIEPHPPVESEAKDLAEPNDSAQNSMRTVEVETDAATLAVVEPIQQDSVAVNANAVSSNSLRSVDEVSVSDQAEPADDTDPEVLADATLPEIESRIEALHTIPADEPTDTPYSEQVRGLESFDAGPEPVEVADAAPESTMDKQTDAQPVEAASERGGPGGGGLGGTVEQGDRAAGQSGVDADYNLLLRNWLERHKRYPRRAMRARQQGTVFLYFVMDRAGNVVDYRLRESSGHPLLDEEVEKMIHRAQPLPRIPDSLDENRLAFVVPIKFSLR